MILIASATFADILSFHSGQQKSRILWRRHIVLTLGSKQDTIQDHLLSSCKIFVENLQDCSNKKRKSMPFGAPVMWKKDKDPTTDCYFCLTNLKGCNRKNKYHVKYPDVPFISKLIPHSFNLAIPKPNITIDMEPTSDCQSSAAPEYDSYMPEEVR